MTVAEVVVVVVKVKAVGVEIMEPWWWEGRNLSGINGRGRFGPSASHGGSGGCSGWAAMWCSGGYTGRGGDVDSVATLIDASAHQRIG